jgi:hypothetical protein
MKWHTQIWIRRGLCRPCQKTFTVLPDWSRPLGIYSLHCRQKAERAGAMYSTIGADYFHVMQIPLLRGRYFTKQDQESAG